MTEESPNRRLPNRYVRHFFHAVEEQMGVYSLHMMLRQAGLERYIDQLPRMRSRAELLSSEYADFQKAIRLYYGRGARGSLNRIGRRVFQAMCEEAPFLSRIWLVWIRLLPYAARRKKGLDFLAGQLRKPDGKISVHTLDMDLVFVVISSDATCGQSSGEPICWVTLGMIQEALLWATDEEHDVEEIGCRAVNGDTCTFRIHASTR